MIALKLLLFFFRYGHAFLFDTGSSVGEIIGHSKVINSVSIRQNRPVRAATASDDFTVVFFHGPPFKQKLTIKDHTAFVQGVRFSPDGNSFVTIGSDKKVSVWLLYIYIFCSFIIILIILNKPF
jgi:WD repeat-containing protein 1 (actin-interacting protein 1)